MSLNWYWNDCCGEAVFERTLWNPLEGKDETKRITTKLYQGNAWLIFIYEWKEGDKDMYNVWSFIADKEHMRNCLGLSKQSKGDNIFNRGDCRLVSISLDKNRNSYVKQIVDNLVQAFDELHIKIYTSEKENSK